MGFWWVLRFALYPASVKIPVDTTFFHFKLVGHSIGYSEDISSERDEAATETVVLDGLADALAPAELTSAELTSDAIASAPSASPETPDTAQSDSDSLSDTPSEAQAFSPSDLKLLAAGVAASRSASIPKRKQSVAKGPANETTVRVPVEQLRMINQLS